MPIEDVSVISTAPSFARFLFHNHQLFDIGFKAKETSSGYYIKYLDRKIANKSIDFQVSTEHIANKFTTIISINVESPDPHPPTWLQAAVDEYEQVLAKWNSTLTELPVIVRYRYLGE